MSTHDNENNARLKPDVLALLAEQAQAEGRTVDDLLDEAARLPHRREPRTSHQRWLDKSGASPPSLRNTAKKNALDSAVGKCTVRCVPKLKLDI